MFGFTRIPPLVIRLIRRNNVNMANTLQDLDRFKKGQTPVGQSIFRAFDYGSDESIGGLEGSGSGNSDSQDGFDQIF